MARLLQSALRDWHQATAKGAMSEMQAVLALQRIERSLDSQIATEAQAVEAGLGNLAIVATASPFVGLFGTVWGIMHAFQAIAVQKNTNLSVVAPSIAEARERALAEAQRALERAQEQDRRRIAVEQARPRHVW